MAAALTRIAPFLVHRCPRTLLESKVAPCKQWSVLLGNNTCSSFSTCPPGKSLFNSVTRTLSLLRRRAFRLDLGAVRSFTVGQGLWATRSKLPFEVSLKVPKDTLLYQHTNERFFRMLSIFGLAQLVFWGQLAFFSYTSLDVLDSETSEPGVQKNTFWGKVVMLQTKYKERIAGICIAVGSLVMFFTFLYPRRTIRQLVLLKGGKDLRITTYTHFGKTRTFNAPVDNLSVQVARASKASQASLKLKGHRFFYLMDKRDGKFYDTNLFDYAVGLKRNIK